MSNSVNTPFPTNKKKKLYLTILACFLLVATVAITASSVASRKNNSKSNHIQDHEAHGVIKSSCSSTLYQELCVSALTSAPDDATSKVKNIKDVIELSLNLTITAVQHNYFKIMKIITKRARLTVRQKAALHDCLELVDETLYELRKSKEDLRDYLKLNKSVLGHAEDLKTFLSGAMTNQETCLDGFSHYQADKKVRVPLIEGQNHVFHMVSNALAMVKNMTNADMVRRGESNINTSFGTSRHHLSEEEANDSSINWPDWLSVGDRRLLQDSNLTPDVTVAADGTGNYLTVAAAVAAAPTGSSRRYIIKIKAGVYRENVEVPSNKINIMFIGDGRMNTIITASRNVVDGSTTFDSATVAVVGGGFLARDITFQNAAGPSKHQAVALRVNADLSAFYRCGMLGYQDTLYPHSLRQFYFECVIVGTIDFIFGNAAVVLQKCDIQARTPNPGQRNMVTAQGRDDPNQNTGIVIQNCKIGATADLEANKGSVESYLGRPWKMYSRTVIMQTYISDIINPAGWYPWDGDFALDTLYYGEYQNTGPGADTTRRVTWKGFRVITSATEAQAFTASQFIAGGSWLPSTGFPYSLGL